MRRSDRYKSLEETRTTRVRKNKNTYDEINSRIGYDTIPSYNAEDAINLSSFDIENLNRSDYHKIKEYKDLLDENHGLPKDEVNPKKISSIKEYDINKVLEEAKNNRKEDELEGKRKVENISTLNSLNKKYLYEKGFTEEDSQELKELIDTITSKRISDDIRDTEERELLSDLLATTIDIKLEKQLSKEEFDKLLEETFDSTSPKLTKSMDFTEDDLITEESIEEEKNSPKPIKIILISILLIISFFTLLFFILKYFNIF